MRKLIPPMLLFALVGCSDWLPSRHEVNVAQVQARDIAPSHRVTATLHSHTLALSAPHSGKITAIFTPSGNKVEPQQPLYQITLPNEVIDIRAPVAGRLGDWHISQGQTVAVNQRLVELTQFEPMTLHFPVERHVVHTIDTMGLTPADIQFAMFPIADSNASVALNATSLHRAGANDTALEFALDVPNPRGQFFSGMSLPLELKAATERSMLLVPESALFHANNHSYVLKIDHSNRVAKHVVELGLLQQQWRIVKGDLVAGDRLVLGQHVEPGSKVSPIAR
uniref:hypothetical protein n=1 Tax=Thaumasiovibrio occultus TaxID=1891184 RepID=UPI000B35DEA9|nr:hypothetical protein [Thaumasiovibrio occultus]